MSDLRRGTGRGSRAGDGASRGRDREALVGRGRQAAARLLEAVNPVRCLGPSRWGRRIGSTVTASARLPRLGGVARAVSMVDGGGGNGRHGAEQPPTLLLEVQGGVGEAQDHGGGRAGHLVQRPEFNVTEVVARRVVAEVVGDAGPAAEQRGLFHGLDPLAPVKSRRRQCLQR